ncbi:hypothetical protein QAD02_003531 [Eretmocerus hayati]|uniref:Uncharacterized protein n=1 Tax=Eretmocerus hayati TaxID=131215 RepID=A0ACC2NMC1_9HYME|nr:hypothetical protein QAD02_003531 [Eretmocerus hayati]
MNTNTCATKNLCSVCNIIVKCGELSYQCSKCAGLTHSSCCPDIDKIKLTGSQCRACALSEQVPLSHQSTPSSAPKLRHRKRSASSPLESSGSRVKIRFISTDQNPQLPIELNMSQTFDIEAENFQNDPSVPDHLKKLGSLLKSSHSSLQSQLSTIDNRMTANETENARAFARLRADIVATRTQVDPCEVRFSGIPSAINLPDPDVINAILRAIEWVQFSQYGDGQHNRLAFVLNRHLMLVPFPREGDLSKIVITKLYLWLSSVLLLSATSS